MSHPGWSSPLQDRDDGDQREVRRGRNPHGHRGDSTRRRAARDGRWKPSSPTDVPMPRRSPEKRRGSSRRRLPRSSVAGPPRAGARSSRSSRGSTTFSSIRSSTRDWRSAPISSTRVQLRTSRSFPPSKWSRQLGRTFSWSAPTMSFRRTANAIIRDQVTALRGDIVGEQYLLLGSRDVGGVVEKIEPPSRRSS